MAEYGLLIDYEYCTGCETCVVACKEEHGFPVGKWGIEELAAELAGKPKQVLWAPCA